MDIPVQCKSTYANNFENGKMLDKDNLESDPGRATSIIMKLKWGNIKGVNI